LCAGFDECTVDNILRSTPGEAFERSELDKAEIQPPVPESIKNFIFDYCLVVDPGKRKSFAGEIEMLYTLFATVI